MDGVLGELQHEVVMWKSRGKASTIVSCVAAFRPLMGKQLVAWRFMRPDTLVCAVRTAGCHGAAAEEDEEAGCKSAAAEGGEEAGCSAAAADGGEETGCSAAAEEEGEEEESCGVDDVGARGPPPSMAPLGPQARHTTMMTIKVTGPGWADDL